MTEDGWQQVQRYFFWRDGQTIALIEKEPHLPAHPWRWAAWPGTGADRCDYAATYAEARAAAERVLAGEGQRDGKGTSATSGRGATG